MGLAWSFKSVAQPVNTAFLSVDINNDCCRKTKFRMLRHYYFFVLFGQLKEETHEEKLKYEEYLLLFEY